MKIIVTGATGFLGQHVVKRFKREGYEPFALGRNQKVGSQLQTSHIPFIPTELSDLSQVMDAFSTAKSPDYVVHCAALSSPWGSYKEFFSANVLATKHIIQACSEFKVKRLIYISTPSIYFNYQSRLLVKEHDPLPEKMVNSYAETKKIAEECVLDSDIPSVILRPRGIFGPGDTVLFPRLLRSLNRLPLIDGGNAVMDITYVENVVDSILLALFAQSSHRQCYNITNDQPMRFIDLIRLLCNKLEVHFSTKQVSFKKAYFIARWIEGIYKLFPFSEPPITCYGVGLLAKSMTLDISKARKELGYAPRISIDEGFDRFAAWWKAHE